MDEKLKVVNFLLNEINDEVSLFKRYNNHVERAIEEAKAKGGYYWQYLEYKGRLPSKARIRENCKKIRQLTLDISKEMEGI